MKRSLPYWMKKTGAARLVILLLIMTTLVAILWAARPQGGRADSGGFPTPTRPVATFFIFPTITPTFTLQPPPLPTMPMTEPTLAPALEVQTVQPILAPTPITSARPSGSLFCIPFAIAFILVVIIASIALIGRRSP